MNSIKFRITIAIVALFVSINALAADVKFVASAPNAVVVGESFQVVYSINATSKNLRVPSFNGFNLIAGPFTSTSSSVQWVNGKRTSSKDIRYTYTLLAEKEGTFNIPAASVVVGGDKYQSNTLQIKVLPEDKTNSSQNNSGTSTSNSQKASVNNTFVKPIISKTRVHEQEAILLTYKIYSKLDLVDIRSPKFPDFQNFLVQEIELPTTRQLQYENYKGANYYTYELTQYLLFPQMSGKLKIDPMSCDVIVRVPLQRQSRSFFDGFFESYQEVQRTLSASPITVNVDPLPTPKPSNFSGAVGDFTLTSSISTTDLKAHESITIKIKIKGSGNMKIIKIPELTMPKDFETYEPKQNNNFTNSNSGISGYKEIEYLLIPRHDGKFNIPAISFSYFDLKTNSYKTLSSDSYDIIVHKGEGGETTQAVSNFTNQESVEQLGTDIRFLAPNMGEIIQTNSYFAGTSTFWLALLLPLILSIALMIFFRKQARDNANVALMRNKKANKVALKRLKIAEKEWKNGAKESFYDEILKALWGYLCDKLSIPLSDLNKENVEQALAARDVDAALISQFIDLLNQCEFEKYAPLQDTKSAMDKIFNSTISIISQLEGIIKK